VKEPRILFEADDIEGVDQLSARAFRAFHRALRLHRRVLMQAFAQHGIHHGQAMCLRLLADEGGVTQRDIACDLHASSPTITKMMTSMERAGLVRRSPDAADGRLVRVELTEAGRSQEREMRAAAMAYTERTFATLAEDERRELARLLDKLSDAIEELAAAGHDEPAADPFGDVAAAAAAPATALDDLEDAL
jgi:MarR family transcriptional regulator, organic hydroperoxide resistance regulator